MLRPNMSEFVIIVKSVSLTVAIVIFSLIAALLLFPL